MNDREYAYLKHAIRKELGFDADSYRSAQMRRRLSGFVERRAGGNVSLVCKRLHSDPDLRGALLRLVTINVSEFFRDPAQFVLLQDIVLPDLAARNQSVRIWSAGCSHGEEPFTIAILCERAQIGARVDILATDIDAESLATARAGGPYTAQQLRKMPARLVPEYFNQSPRGYMLRESTRRRVRFLKHDLLSDPAPHQFDLIVCRNVTIYFTQEVKAQLIRRFFASLRPGGYLFIGGAESLLGAEAEGFSRIAGNFYRKDVQHARQAALSARR
jgi:chemotaxis protein methyltransferase CheR